MSYAVVSKSFFSTIEIRDPSSLDEPPDRDALKELVEDLQLVAETVGITSQMTDIGAIMHRSGVQQQY